MVRVTVGTLICCGHIIHVFIFIMMPSGCRVFDFGCLYETATMFRVELCVGVTKGMWYALFYEPLAILLTLSIPK